MISSRFFSFLLPIALFAGFLDSANAEPAKSKIKSPAKKVAADELKLKTPYPIPLSGVYGKKIDIKLRDLLTVPGYPNPLAWKLLKMGQDEIPSWLSIENGLDDTGNARLVGTPPLPGTYKFQIAVSDGDVKASIAPVNLNVPAPPQWPVDPIDLGVWLEDQESSRDLNNFVTNPVAGTTLTFEIISGKPSWMRLEGSKLIGTPKRADVGNFKDLRIRAIGVGGSAEVGAFGTVKMVVKWPTWVAKEIRLKDGKEDDAYNEDLKKHIINPEGSLTTFKFSVVEATIPNWLELSPTQGNLFGTPKKENVKVNLIVVRFDATINGEIRSDVATFTVEVFPTNHAPQWAVDTITLPQGVSGTTVNAELFGSVKDIDNDPLKFEIVSVTGPGAPWMSINADTAKLTGTPKKENVGTTTWVISAKDPAGLSDTVAVTIKVIKANEPPTWTANPINLKDQKEEVAFTADISEFAVDPDLDKLTFSLEGHPAWLKIDPNSGIVSGRAGPEDAKLYTFNAKVTDNISGSSTTKVQVLVIDVNHNPVWTINPLEVSANEDEVLDIDLALYANDSDKGDKLTFKKTFGPNWADVTVGSSHFKGTPVHGNDGINTFRVSVMDDKGGIAVPELTIKVNVIHKNHKPYWKEPVTLANATEDVAYDFSVADKAVDPDGDGLSYTVTGPKWLEHKGNGVLGGMPRRIDAGTYDVSIRIEDPSGEFAVTNTKITVIKVNKPPYWRQPIDMGKFDEDLTGKFDLADYAIDPDGDPITFTLVNYQGPGQQWTFVDSKTGRLTGTPMKDNIGLFSVTVSITDNKEGHVAVEGQASGEVLHRNHPPVVTAGIEFKVKEDTTFTVDLNDPLYVKDLDQDKLNFVVQDKPSFVEFVAGKITAKPVYKDIGKHIVSFKVNDQEIAVPGSVTIIVERNPSAPIWLQDPIKLEAKTGEDINKSIASFAKEKDGLTLTFSRKPAGKPWLKVAGNGALTGVPLEGDLGLNLFKVTACNPDPVCTDADLEITVIPGTKTQTIDLATAVPGAPIDLLWVVDNSCQTNAQIAARDTELAKLLKQHIGQFFVNLGEVHHAGVYLSSDTSVHKALPIKATGQDPVMTWATPSIAANFSARVDKGMVAAPCPRNSPTFTMFRFYEQLPGMADVYKKNYFNPEVPMEVMIMSTNYDEFPWYIKNIPEMANYSAPLFALDFKKFHLDERKPYRINAVAKTAYDGTEVCTKLPGPANTYSTLVNATYGTFYPWVKYFDMAGALKDYAKQVAFRANVNAKHHITLNQVPIDPTSIVVTVAGVKLNSDQWRYDSSTNQVVIFWYLVDQKLLKPGDKLVITYRVS